VHDDLRRRERLHAELLQRRVHDRLRRQREVLGLLHRRQLHDELSCGLDVQRHVHGRQLQDLLRRGRDLQRELPRRQLHVHGGGLQMRRAVSIAIVSLLLATSSAASAQGDKALAKEAYDRGTQAHARGDFRHAAEEFARADALAPSPVALQAALDAAVDADDFVLGAELLERTKRLGSARSATLAASIDAATKKLGGRAGHVKVVCPSGARCSATIDGAAFDASKGVWLRTGPHTLAVQVDGTPDTRTVEIRAGEDMEVVAARAPSPAAPTPTAVPAPAPAPAAHPSATPTGADTRAAKPLPPIVFWVGAGVTVVLGGATTYFALTASSKHSKFTDAGCGAVATSSCADLKDSGESAQTTANIGFAVTGVAAAATVVIGVLLTDWPGSRRAARAPVLVPVAGGMAASWSATF
jgi:hypothetical protein